MKEKAVMTPDVALNQLTEAMLLVMWLSMPPIAVAALIGVVVSLLQALTQIQEQTLSFAIKLIAVAATIAAMASVLGNQMFLFTEKILDNFPYMT
jgi:type III secretion protein S